MVLYWYFRVPGTIGHGFSGDRPFFSLGEVHVKALRTLDSVEQKNYAVGEQRERDTKGWSASEANKLRTVGRVPHTPMERKTPVAILREERETGRDTVE